MRKIYKLIAKIKSIERLEIKIVKEFNELANDSYSQYCKIYQ